MRYFIDAEFWERPGAIDLISIGIVAEDGREYYAENSQFDWPAVTERAQVRADYGNAGDTPRWLLKNVRPHLGLPAHQRSPKFIATDIREFISVRDGGDVIPDPSPQFWGWYADYDWVVFCWLQGRMIDLPKGWPMYCRDLKQVFDMFGNPKVPKEALPMGPEHNALADARELHHKFNWFVEYASGFSPGDPPGDYFA